MAAPQAVSGNSGKVILGGSVIAEISKWKATIDRGLKTYGAQSGVVSGVGWEKTLVGTHKCTGSFEGYFDNNYAPGTLADVDTLVTLSLYLVYPSAYITGSARISTHDLSADIDTGDPEPFTYNFQFHGAPTFVGL